MSDTMKKIKATITALLAKAKGTDNEHEAEAFLAKAMSMMEQYQLDVLDMVGEDDPILKHVGLSRASSGHAWRWRLYSKVAQLYGCKSIHVECILKNEDGTFQKDKHGRYIEGYEQTLVGRESAIITTDLMYPWIVEQVRAHAKRLVAEDKANGAKAMSEQGQAKRVAAALISRIAVMIHEQEAAKPETAAGRNALVVMDQVNAAYEQMFPDTQLKNTKTKTDDRSRQAAESIGLHRQTTGGAKPLALGGR